MKKETVYTLNPHYRLKTDKNRIIIFNRDGSPDVESFIGFVHPIYAILLSLFDGKRKLHQVISEASETLGMDNSIISRILTPLLENKKPIHFHFDQNHFSFPGMLLMPNVNGAIGNELKISDLFISRDVFDVDTWRLHSPLDALFVVNTLCVTDCTYCYADRSRRMDCEIPFERLKQIINEARELGMRSFDITGGELFLYRYWEELLTHLIENDFIPYISTKCAIDEKTIVKLKELGINKIQVSIDSIIATQLNKLLNTKGEYYNRLLESLKLLDSYQFEINTNSQITSINQESVCELLDYLVTIKNIRRIKLGVAGFSLYKGENAFLKYRPELEKVLQIEEKVDRLKKEFGDNIDISFSGYSTKVDFFEKSTDKRAKDFGKRARCSGNFYSFIILPDGKVTVCEELYWKPEFIIGDLKKQSIREAWNSKRALELYNLSKIDIRPESECHQCEEFDACHKYQGVCWKEVLYAYGENNWDYPDPKCPKARKPIRQYYL